MRATIVGAWVIGISLALAAPGTAAPAPGFARAATVDAQSQSMVQKVEFVRRPDGSVYYKRADPNSKGPFLFYYRGYAYPYYPGYAYRQERGELQPYDRPHRVKVRE